MEAIQVGQFGGPEVLIPAQIPIPAPGPGQVLIKLGAIGVNFIDVYHRTGRYPNPLPFIPGSEGAGTVAALGPGAGEVAGVAVGDRVGWANAIGGYTQYALIPADRVVPVPDQVSDELAAATLLQGMTAHYLTHDTYRVQPGDTVLVHAGAGGMGLLLTQLGARIGARVIATTSTEAKEALARAAGADEVIRYDRAEVAPAVRELTNGAGVDAVYDGVGQATFEASLASLRPRGMLVLFGAASGPVPPFDLARLGALGSLFVTRPSLGHYLASRAELTRRASDVLGWVADGSLRVRISERYPLAEARAAHAALEGRRTTGKLLLLP